MAKKTATPARRSPTTIDDLYGGGDSGNLLHPDFHESVKVHEWIQRRHAKARKMIDEEGYYRRDGHEWKVPYGLRQAIAVPLVYNQVVVKYPFFVAWISPRTGRRHKKYVSSIPAGIILIATKLQYIDENAYLVSRTVGYNVPAKLRGKFPRRAGGKTYYWCPACMTARRFVHARPEQEFYAMKKFWSDEKGRYIWKDVKLALLKCSHCPTTNRDSKFRNSNQPYELRKIKKGVRRIKKRKQRRK